jgi:hypothetical protein
VRSGELLIVAPKTQRSARRGALPDECVAASRHEQGADVRLIMEVLGHSSVRVTMDICTFVRLDAQRSAVTAMRVPVAV